MPTEWQLSKHGMDLLAVAWAAGLVHLSVRAVGEGKCALEFSLTEEQILIVVLASTHGATAKVVEQNTVFDLREPGEVKPEVVAPKGVDAKHPIRRENVRHDCGLVSPHKIGHGVLIEQAAIKVGSQFFLENLHNTTALVFLVKAIYTVRDQNASLLSPDLLNVAASSSCLKQLTQSQHTSSRL